MMGDSEVIANFVPRTQVFQNHLILLSFLAFLIILPYSITVCINPYHPETDETWQLQAAYRIANGEGYTCSWNPPQDLSVPHYDYLTNWPPGYPLIIAGIMKAGISLEWAAKVIKICLLFFGFLFWTIISDKFLETLWTKSIFVACISVTAIFYAFSSTDIFLWAIFPLFITLIILRKENTSRSIISSALEYMVIVLAGILCSLLFLVKYLGVVFLPIGLALIWLSFSNKKDLKNLFLKSLLFILLPILTIIGVYLINTESAGQLSSLVTGKETLSSLHFSPQWLLAFVRAFFLISPFNILLNIVMTKMGLVSSHIMMIIFGLSLVFCVAFTYIIYKAWKISESKRLIIKGFLLSIFFLFCILFVATSRLNITFTSILDSDFDLTPIGHSRYYIWVFPLLMISALLYFDKLSRDGKVKVRLMNGLAIALNLFALISITGFSIHKGNQLKQYQEKKKMALFALNDLIGSDRNVPIVIFGHNPYINFFLWEDYIPTYRDIEILLSDHPRYFSQPTFIFIFKDKLNDLDRAQESGERLIQKVINLYRMKSRETNSFVLYWRKFDKGTLADQKNGRSDGIMNDLR